MSKTKQSKSDGVGQSDKVKKGRVKKQSSEDAGPKQEIAVRPKQVEVEDAVPSDGKAVKPKKTKAVAKEAARRSLRSSMSIESKTHDLDSTASTSTDTADANPKPLPLPVHSDKEENAQAPAGDDAARGVAGQMQTPTSSADGGEKGPASEISKPMDQRSKRARRRKRAADRKREERVKAAIAAVATGDMATAE